MSEVQLNSSKLGTQEYWDKFYEVELRNFEVNSEDTGERWFDDSDAENRMIQFLMDKISTGEVSNKGNIIDLGTGNGHLLFQLFEDLKEEGENVNFTYCGIDYSPTSVKFAKSIANEKYEDLKVDFEHVDLLSAESNFLKHNEDNFDILLDKGTFDAIALNQAPLSDHSNKIGIEVYPSQILKLMHTGSIFLITSCNFTEEELIKVISKNESNGLKVWEKIKYPSFKFGGQTGSTICTIAFVKE